jgi:carboxyl-terminal processing protease
VSRLLRGEEGTRVEVEVERDRIFSFTIERRTYVRPTVRGELLGEDLGVIRITHLSRNTEEQVAATMQDLFREHRIRRILLDLRGNTGGSMLTAAAIADLFLKHGVLLEALDRNDRPGPGLRARVEASGRGWDRIPLAVLVDGSTGSSAELLAAALAWNDRALLIGEPTFGKNIVQKMHQFDDVDLTVKISSAYMKAAGRRLPAEGLPPDVWVEPEGDAPPEGEGAIVRQAPEGGRSWERLALAILDAHADASRSVMMDGLRGDAAAETEAAAPRPVPGPGQGPETPSRVSSPAGAGSP